MYFEQIAIVHACVPCVIYSESSGTLGKRANDRTMRHDATAERLKKLSDRLADEMERTEALGRTWLAAPPQDADIAHYNVIICGAGMSGMAVAFGLKRRGVDGVMVIDQAEKGREGPWIGCARMKTLRSPKFLAGPDFGLPALTPRSWCEAVYGKEAWEGLDKISREDWMSYLEWYRSVTRPQIENGTRLVDIRHEAGWLELDVETAGVARSIRCRRLVLATGIDGGGGPRIPAIVKDLPKQFWTHSAEIADDSHLKDRDIAVFGSATSSFDWAVKALETGARKVAMIGRSRDFGRTEVLAWTNFPGYLAHFADLPDLQRWRFARLYNSFKVPPTQEQFDQAISYPNFSMQLGHAVRSVTVEGTRLRIETDNASHMADHILLGTGYALDISKRDELKSLAPLIALWRDRFEPPVGEPSDDIGSHPYLGRGFELQAKDPALDGWLLRIHMFNGAAVPSMGPVSNGVTGMKFGLARIVEAVTNGLFAETATDLMRDLADYKECHFDPRGHGCRQTDEKETRS
jgi:FAD-dependent urate hydroxylase